jgi:glyoxylase-like metal-dependent hydrolase (beta-lactamase superfamily II)
MLVAYRTLFVLMRAKGVKIVPIAEIAAFGDGEALDVPGEPRVVHPPGHSECSCAILLEGRNALVTGDALSAPNPLTGRTGPRIAADGLNHDSEQAMRSRDALEPIRADALLPGHGDPWTRGTGDAIRLARAAGRS